MRTTFTTKLIAAQAIYTSINTAFAHDGHHMQGSHWHASDAFGFAALAAAIALALWFSKGGK
jgi:hypothetical protein